MRRSQEDAERAIRGLFSCHPLLGRTTLAKHLSDFLKACADALPCSQWEKAFVSTDLATAPFDLVAWNILFGTIGQRTSRRALPGTVLFAARAAALSIHEEFPRVLLVYNIPETDHGASGIRNAKRLLSCLFRKFLQTWDAQTQEQDADVPCEAIDIPDDTDVLVADTLERFPCLQLTAFPSTIRQLVKACTTFAPHWDENILLISGQYDEWTEDRHNLALFVCRTFFQESDLVPLLIRQRIAACDRLFSGLLAGESLRRHTAALHAARKCVQKLLITLHLHLASASEQEKQRLQTCALENGKILPFPVPSAKKEHATHPASASSLISLDAYRRNHPHPT